MCPASEGSDPEAGAPHYIDRKHLRTWYSVASFSAVVLLPKTFPLPVPYVLCICEVCARGGTF
jgi:hypothetical protein